MKILSWYLIYILTLYPKFSIFWRNQTSNIDSRIAKKKNLKKIPIFLTRKPLKILIKLLSICKNKYTLVSLFINCKINKQTKKSVNAHLFSILSSYAIVFLQNTRTVFYPSVILSILLSTMQKNLFLIVLWQSINYQVLIYWFYPQHVYTVITITNACHVLGFKSDFYWGWGTLRCFTTIKKFLLL
jgi:hypothetical protein